MKKTLQTQINELKQEVENLKKKLSKWSGTITVSPMPISGTGTASGWVDQFGNFHPLRIAELTQIANGGSNSTALVVLPNQGGVIYNSKVGNTSN